MSTRPYAPAAEHQAFTAMRIVLAAMMFIHGTTRISIEGGVAEFGGWLVQQHIPAGLAVAWTITLMEISATLLIAAGRFVRPLSLYFAFQLVMGIILVHGPNGWFVVGAGRNGMEFSVLLISGFLAQAWAAAPERRPELAAAA